MTDDLGNTDPEPRTLTPLAWPPPGLESLRAAVWTLRRRIGIASVLVVAPLLWFGAAAGFGADPRSTGETMLVLAACTLVGCALLLRAALTLWGFASRATTCVHRGYTWLTVAEVAADRRGDTGAVIAGSNEYDALSPSTRVAIRAARLVVAVCVMAAATLPLIMLVIAGWIARSGAPLTTFAPLVVFAPSGVAMLLAAMAARTERHAVRAARAERERAVSQLGASRRVIEPWYASFDHAREGQWLGKGKSGGSMWGLAGGAAVGAAFVGVIAVVAPLLLVTAVGGWVDGELQYLSVATRIAQVESMRAYALPIDTSISPQTAGDAYYSIAMTSLTPRPYLVPPKHQYAGLPSPPDSLFGRRRWTGYQWLQRTVLRTADSGFTTVQRDFVERVARDSVWEAYSIVARAARADAWTAMLKVPLPRSVTHEDLPTPSYARLSELTSASVVRAAWHLDRGQDLEAERVLRETVSLGFRIIDNANSTTEALIGSTTVATGREGLIRLFQLTGRSDEARRLAQVDSVATQARRLGGVSWTSVSALGVTRDRRTPRYARWDAVGVLAYAPCGNLRAMLFGPSPAVRSAIERARRDLVRSAAEGELFDAYAQALDRIDIGQSRDALTFLANIPGAVLSNPRISRCAAVAPGH